MGKVKKTKQDKMSGRGDCVLTKRSGALHSQILQDKYASASGRVEKRRSKHRGDHGDAAGLLGSSLSAKILTQARLQRDEEQDELRSSSDKTAGTSEKFCKASVSLGAQPLANSDVEESDNEEQVDFGEESDAEEIELSPEDQAALDKFLGPNAPLANAVFDTILEKQTELTEKMSQMEVPVCDIHPKLEEMYKGVGEVLSKYRSGKLPKAFKIIPKLSNWEQILLITQPDNWSAAAMYQATRIFVSNMNASMSQRIRDDIASYKKLNFHLYQALKKALFKPGSFFKGLLLPLCESETCTLLEARIIGSVLVKCSIPMLHVAAVMMKIAEMDYQGPNSIFLSILIGKQYTLPYRVLDALIHHFLRFHGDQRDLPVLWHQCLLTFVKIYKEDISWEQKESLMELIKRQSHYQITPEIRSELQNSKCRGEEADVVMCDSKVLTVDNPDMDLSSSSTLAC